MWRKFAGFTTFKFLLSPLSIIFAGTLSPLSRLINLAKVTGARNQLTGDLTPLGFILHNFFTDIELQGNRLQGTLEGIAGLEFLLTLNLASNQLGGELEYLTNKVKLVRHCSLSHTCACLPAPP
jgi:hypothetical protein